MDPWFMGAAELAAEIRAKRISATELLDGYLARINHFNPALNAIIIVDEEAARRAATAADEALAASADTGPLHGVPMTIKESFDLAGHPSTFGRPDRRNHAAARDALTVQRLKAAGAIVMGKSNVPLDLAEWQSFNEIYGVTVNPFDTTRTPGGSSGGAAAGSKMLVDVLRANVESLLEGFWNGMLAGGYDRAGEKRGGRGGM